MLIKSKIYSALSLLILFSAISEGVAVAQQTAASFPQPFTMENSWLDSDSTGISLNKMANLPDWASITVQQRTRYETLNNAFRAGATGSDQIVSLRTLSQGEFRLNNNLMLRLEFQDSRTELVDSATFLNNTMINPAELLEANLQWSPENLFEDGSKSLLRVGRITMDVGSRRLVARNRFRNVLEGFSGADWIWQASNGAQVRTFYTLSVNRLPNQRDGLARNDVAMDQESFDRRFWGLYVASPNMPGDLGGELYLFGLDQKENRELLIQSRKLYTPGVRIYQPKVKGRFDYEMESSLQFGTSRDPVTGGQDLDHFANYHHIEGGYTFSSPWSPRFLLEYDYSSGDANAKDGKNGAFDNLFGESVVDYGPTSIYSAFNRSNLSSPGARLQIHPDRATSAFLSYRTFWLASNTAPWVGSSGLRDITGQSSPFIGHQFYLQTKWKALANLLFEGGAVYRINGDFQDTAPNSPHEGNTTYIYISTTLSF